MSDGFEDRRYFPRIKVRIHGVLTDAHGMLWPVHILDLSFNGALAALLDHHHLAVGERVVLRIQDEESKAITMQGRVAHCREHFVGIECRATGIDNQTQLRELLKRCQRKANNLALAGRSYESLIKDYQPRF